MLTVKTIRVEFDGNQHLLIDILIKGLDDAVFVVVPLRAKQVDLAIKSSELNRVYNKYKIVTFEPFSNEDPILRRSKTIGEIFDDFKDCIGRAIFESYRHEFLRAYNTQTNITSTLARQVWA